MKNNNILSMGNNSRGADKRRAILNLFLADNPAFEVCLRKLQDRRLPDNDRIALKRYEDEPLNAQIERYCLNLQSVLFTLSVFPEVKIPDEVLEGFFDVAGALIYALHHLADCAENSAGDFASEHTGEGVPGLRCAPSGLRTGEMDMDFVGRQKVPGLALLGLLRGDSL